MPTAATAQQVAQTAQGLGAPPWLGWFATLLLLAGIGAAGLVVIRLALGWWRRREAERLAVAELARKTAEQQVEMTKMLAKAAEQIERGADKFERLEAMDRALSSRLERAVTWTDFGAKSDALHTKINELYRDTGERLAVIEDRLEIPRRAS